MRLKPLATELNVSSNKALRLARAQMPGAFGTDLMKRPLLSLLLALALVPCSVSLAQVQNMTYNQALNDGHAKSQNKDFNGAILAFEEAAKMTTTPDQKSTAYYYIGATYRNDKKNDKAIEFFTKSLEVPGISDARKALSTQYLADLYFGEAKYDLARENYNKIKALPGASPEAKFQACYNTGRSYSTRDNAPQARAAYAEILTIPGMSNNQLSDAYNAMALSSFTAKNLPQAESDLNNSLKLEGISDDRKQRARIGLAGLAKSNGNIPEAIKAYEELLADKTLSNPNRANCSFMAADLYLSQKPPLTDKAKACFESILTNPGASPNSKISAQKQLDKLNNPAPVKAPAPARNAVPPAATQPAR
jgi:tetratricopeptide (TPR) repeat protein